jgi:basic membrane protein A
VPQDVRDQIGQMQERIVAGDFAPFTGPISKQDGSEAYADGTVAELSELLSMDYFVEGVVGSATG